MASTANQEKNRFMFKRDLKEYCENDVEILLRVTTAFIKANFLYQADLVQDFGMPPEWQALINNHNNAIEAQAATIYKKLMDNYVIGTDMSCHIPIMEKVTQPRLVFPFSHLNPTMSSLSFKMMKQYTNPKGMFYVSPVPYCKHISRSSLIEREFFFVMQKFGKRLGKPYYSKKVVTLKKLDT